MERPGARRRRRSRPGTVFLRCCERWMATARRRGQPASTKCGFRLCRTPSPGGGSVRRSCRGDRNAGKTGMKEARLFRRSVGGRAVVHRYLTASSPRMTYRALRHRSGGGGEDGAVGRLRGQSPAAVEGRDPERRCRRRRQAPDVGTNMAGSPSVTGRGTASSARFLSLTR